MNFFEKHFFQNSIERALFNLYMLIFAITALVTISGLIFHDLIIKEYLDKLFYTLIIEVIGGITALFSSKFIDKKKTVQVRLEPESPIDYHSTDDLTSTVKFVEAKDDSFIENEQTFRILQDDKGLFITINSDKSDMISISMNINGAEFQGSAHLKSRIVNLKKVN